MLEKPPSPMRILMTSDTGGCWTYVLDLARALDNSNVEIALATMGGPLSNQQLVEIRSIAGLKLFEGSFRLEWMKDPWRDVEEAGRWLLAIERELEPDVIHLNGYAHAALSFRAPTLVFAHSCALSWWRAVKRAAPPSRLDRYSSEIANGLQAADMVVAPSQALLSEIERIYGRVERAQVIPTGRDPSLFGRRSKETIVLGAGRLGDQAKNLVALERAAPDLRWPVYLAGERDYPRCAVARTKNFFHLGRLQEGARAAWMGKASIYVLPARYDPSGLSVLEAALCECALVLGNIPSLRERWEGAAVFVPPDNVSALRNAIEELIRDTTRRKALAARARFRALEFTPQRMAASYLSAYSELAACARHDREPHKITCAS